MKDNSTASGSAKESSMTAAEEREAVVRWLREMDAKRPSDNYCAWIARMIEAGEHIKETSE